MVYPSKQRYDSKNLVKVNVAFNRNTDREMAEFMEHKENRGQYIRDLVRADLDRMKAEGKL